MSNTDPELIRLGQIRIAADIHRLNLREQLAKAEAAYTGATDNLIAYLITSDNWRNQ